MTLLRLESTSKKINSDPRTKRYSPEEKKQHLLFLLQRSLHFPSENLTRYASRHQISRHSLYKLQSKAHLLLIPQKTGPKEKTSSSIASSELLTQNAQCLPPMASDEPNLPTELLNSLGSIPSKLPPSQLLRLVRTFLTLLTSPLSSSNLIEALNDAFGIKLSNSQYCALSQFSCQKASILLKKMEASLELKKVGLDEVYSSAYPIFMGVELNSSVVFLAQKQEKCTGTLWKKALSEYAFKEVVSDQGKALNKGVRKKRKKHQWDLAHLKKNLRKQLNIREACAYKKIKNEYRAQKKAKRKVSWEKKYQEIKQEVREYLANYDPDEKDIRNLLSGLEIFDEEGELKDLGENMKKMELVCERLKKSKNGWSRHIGRTYSDQRVWRYQKVLWEKLEKIKLNWRGVHQVEKMEVLRILSFKHFEERDFKNRWKKRSREKQERVEWRREGLSELMSEKRKWRAEEEMKLRFKLKNFDQVKCGVDKAFSEMLRASSEVEGVNSRIRLMQQTRKGLSQEFLDLWRWKHNNTRFEEGKRRGKSPYELAGVTKAGLDWKTELLFG